MKTRLIIIAGVCSIIFGCKTPISGYYSYETECMGKNYDGTQVVRTFGTGDDVRSAQTRAYQEALHDILFEGIRNGNSDCSVIPLVTEVNALQKYESYFHHFFSNDGNYRDFIQLNRTNRRHVNQRSNMKEAYSYVIEVDVPSLKRQLQTDNIIP